MEPQNVAIGPVHTNMGIFKTADFSMRFGRSSTCKRSIRSLKLKLFENSCQDEDFQKLRLQCRRVASEAGDLGL